MMKRFNHFVNSEEEDDNLVFVPMREQKMPKQWMKVPLKAEKVNV